MFKLLVILRLNVDDKDVEGMFLVDKGLNEELNIDEEVVIVFVCGGDWLILDYEMFEDVVLWGSVIMFILEKLLDIDEFDMEGWF